MWVCFLCRFVAHTSSPTHPISISGLDHLKVSAQRFKQERRGATIFGLHASNTLYGLRVTLLMSILAFFQQWCKYVFNLNNNTAIRLYAINSRSFDVSIATKYYIYKTLSLIITFMKFDLWKHAPRFYDYFTFFSFLFFTIYS